MSEPENPTTDGPGAMREQTIAGAIEALDAMMSHSVRDQGLVSLVAAQLIGGGINGDGARFETWSDDAIRDEVRSFVATCPAEYLPYVRAASELFVTSLPNVSEGN